ncbi:hypothetical protein H920_13070 [Fukomys damarensis]|uniref:Uncharacterized protein n=1 Tax=Fukomys damarensis TaxID=885580 RepID=A0A091D3F8_FUKDA|nr:hypothetical protein H920_13070 [Fukomys damarensis]
MGFSATPAPNSTSPPQTVPPPRPSVTGGKAYPLSRSIFLLTTSPKTPMSTPLPSPLTVGDWARPSWLLGSRLPPPQLLYAPVLQSLQSPSGLASSLFCACAAWSAGALSGDLRLRSPSRWRLFQCLMA